LQITRDELCLTVPAHRTHKVANNKPVPVTVYDYYDRSKTSRIFYEPTLTTVRIIKIICFSQFQH
jgi:CD109 antigen